jgi:hypothetical protein
VNRREGLQKSFVIGDNRCYFGLLEHDLGNPDGIGITGFSPGEISAVLLKPMKQTLLNLS